MYDLLTKAGAKLSSVYPLDNWWYVGFKDARLNRKICTHSQIAVSISSYCFPLVVGKNGITVDEDSLGIFISINR